MQYATKLMVVPYVNKLENPAEKYVTDMDSEMSTILSNKNISIDDKVKLYTQILQRFRVVQPSVVISNSAPIPIEAPVSAPEPSSSNKVSKKGTRPVIPTNQNVSLTETRAE